MPAERDCVACAVEDDVLHRLATQCRCLRFTQYPAHRIDDVGFAAAVGADNADQLAGRAYVGRIDKRLEASELDVGETHGNPVREQRARNTSGLRQGPTMTTPNYSGLTGLLRLRPRRSPRAHSTAAQGPAGPWCAQRFNGRKTARPRTRGHGHGYYLPGTVQPAMDSA